MSSKLNFNSLINLLMQSIKKSGREVERALQLASGTAFLTLLATLSSTWTNLLEPVGHLRIAFIAALSNLSVSFAAAILATFMRVGLEIDERASELASEPARIRQQRWLVGRLITVGTCVMWLFFVGSSLHYGYRFGTKLIGDLLHANDVELEQNGATIDELKKRVEALERADNPK